MHNIETDALCRYLRLMCSRATPGSLSAKVLTQSADRLQSLETLVSVRFDGLLDDVRLKNPTNTLPRPYFVPLEPRIDQKPPSLDGEKSFLMRFCRKIYAIPVLLVLALHIFALGLGIGLSIAR